MNTKDKIEQIILCIDDLLSILYKIEDIYPREIIDKALFYSDFASLLETCKVRKESFTKIANEFILSDRNEKNKVL